ncbi:MAG: DUF6788 family protein [Candidatus Dormibacteraceae bacterium]
MAAAHDLSSLEAERNHLHAELSGVGDLRRGSVTVARPRCGKAYCACADPSHPGHGPVHLLTKSVAGKTVTKSIRPGQELEKVEREVANYKRFKGVVEQIVEVNEQICEARPLTDSAAESGEKGGPSGKRSKPRSRGR